MKLYFTETCTRGVLYEKWCSAKLHKIHRKTPVPRSLIQYSCWLGGCYFVKKETPAQVFSIEFGEISKNTLFTEHLCTTADSEGTL